MKKVLCRIVDNAQCCNVFPYLPCILPGAMLVIVNTQFMLVQAHQHYKMFSNSTNLWIIGSNLLLVVGHSLAVVPFLLDTERLCALIGTHKPLQSTESKVGLVSVIVNVSFPLRNPIKLEFISL